MRAAASGDGRWNLQLQLQQQVVLLANAVYACWLSRKGCDDTAAAAAAAVCLCSMMALYAHAAAAAAAVVQDRWEAAE
jgi:hypothetical protein